LTNVPPSKREFYNDHGIPTQGRAKVFHEVITKHGLCCSTSPIFKKLVRFNDGPDGSSWYLSSLTLDSNTRI